MDQKNFIVAIVLSVIIIMGWQTLFPAKPTTPPQQQQTSQTTPAPNAPTGGQPAAPGAPPAAAPSAQQVVSRAEALARSPRVTFATPELLGSIALKGARIDDVQLAKHREELDPKSPPVPVLSPVGSEHPYYAEFGWTSSDPAVKVPGPETPWTANQATLAPGKPVRLTEIAPGAVETEFSLVRFEGDQERADKVYEGITPLVAADVADVVGFVASRPSHVNIDQIVVKPRDQASSGRFHRTT